jgi:parallel beta-helix repeat protein
MNFPARLCFFVTLLTFSAGWIQAATAPSIPVPRLSVRDFGAVGDGRTLDTAAVNRAIAAASAQGGGTVEFPAGEYLCHSIHLASRVELHLGIGAVVIAADPPKPGESGGYDAPEANAWSEYQDFGHSHWHNSLMWGEDLVDVAITGPGRIYGRGLSRGNGRIALPVGKHSPEHDPKNPPDVLEADGHFEIVPRPELKPGPFGYPNARDRQPDGAGNKAIALKNCRNITLSGFSVLHGGHFGILATGCDNLIIDGLTIDTNRDGMDVDSCSNVRISNCSVNSPWDDGICLKSSHGLGVARPTENVTINNCFVSGFDEGTLLDGTRTRLVARRGGPIGRIKLGTEAGGSYRNITISNCVFEYCRGLALEQVDGAMLEDIAISNVTMRDVVNAPVFIRLGARLRAPDAKTPGQVRRILINNVVAYGVSADHGILIVGLPGYPIEDVTISNVQIHYVGGGTEEQAKREVPEFEKDYPDPWNFGVMPSWGIFARHVKNLRLHQVDLRTIAADERPAIVLSDAKGVRAVEVNLETAGHGPRWSLSAVRGLSRRDATGLPSDIPASVERANY